MRSLVLGLLLAFPLQALAQEDARTTLVLRGIAATEALDRLVEATGIDLLYGSEVANARPVYCALEDAAAEAHLRCITAAAGLDFYRLSSGTYVVTPAAAEPPRRGVFVGEVVDAETGAPLPYANVFLADASTGTAATERGLFALAGLVAGPHRVVTSYVGYEAAVDSVEVPAGGTVRRRVALRPSVVTPDGLVVVDGLQARLPSEFLGSDALDPEGFAAPGTSVAGPSSVLREAPARIGLTSRWPFADLHIQGGEAGEHRTALDGIPIFEPVAFGRLFSAFSPLAVGQVTVRRAGFGAPAGSSLSGAVEVEHALASGPPSVTVESDPYSGNARVRSGFRLGGNEGAVLVAGRTGLWGVYRPPPLDDAIRDWNRVDPLLNATWLGQPADAAFEPHRHGSEVAFTDLHGAARLRLGAFRTLAVSAYHGTNRVGTELFAAGTPVGAAADSLLLLLAQDRYAWSNTGAQMRHDWLVGARLLASARVRASHHAFEHEYAFAERVGVSSTSTAEGEALLEAEVAADTPARDLNRVSEVAAEGQLAYSFAPGHTVEAGLALSRTGNHFHLGGQNAPVGRGFRLLDRRDAAWLVSGHVEDRLSLGLRTVVEAGARVTYVPARRQAYVEPRLAVRHDLPRSPLGLVALRGAAGLYRQFVNSFELSTIGPSALVPATRFWLPVDEALAPPLAYHAAADVLVEPGEGWAVRGEAYVKVQPSLLDLDYGVLLAPADDDAPFVVETDGRAFGAGLSVERRTTRTATRLAYAYAHAERRYPGRFDDRRVTTPWTEPHRLSAALDVRLGGGLTALARGRGAWGRAWAFRRAYYDYLPAHASGAYGTYGFDTPEDDQAEATLVLDLGLRYVRPLGLARLEVAAEVANVLDRANVLDWSLEPSAQAPGSFERVERTLPGLTPSLRVQLHF
ncbi:MAG: carboxypeptidase-like regulatory domain-containing protein [Rubricoccaceae bacterium]|nr:carboxypeptidase-like regulatory domain-containing protein [Rubricoccaceae bacterium]